VPQSAFIASIRVKPECKAPRDMPIADKIPLNFALLRPWENWVIVGLMAMIFLLSLNILFHEPMQVSVPGT